MHVLKLTLLVVQLTRCSADLRVLKPAQSHCVLRTHHLCYLQHKDHALLVACLCR